MAEQMYISPNGIAKAVSGFYFGDQNNIAHSVVAAYFGDENNIAQLFQLGKTPLPEDLVLSLVDFEYIDNGDGTVTITAWKHTLNGVDSTIMRVPDDARIIL